MQNIIVTTPNELEALIQDSLRKILKEDSSSNPDKERKNKFLSIKEASTFLDLAPQTLYGYTSKGLIPHIKRGKRVLFIKADLEKWLLEGRKLTIQEMKDKLKREGKL